jgi:hypothetical protein
LTSLNAVLLSRMKNSKLIDGLSSLYRDFDESWVLKNSLILNLTRKHKLSFGGSIAMAITRKKAIRKPGDIDLFTNSNEDALEFIGSIIKYLHNKKGSFYRIYVNNETKFTLEGVKSHYRIVGPPYWLPICIMVLKKPIRSYFYHGAKVQFFDDVVKAAKEVTEKDGKERVSMILDEFDWHFDATDDRKECLTSWKEDVNS